MCFMLSCSTLLSYLKLTSRGYLIKENLSFNVTDANPRNLLFTFVIYTKYLFKNKDTFAILRQAHTHLHLNAQAGLKEQNQNQSSKDNSNTVRRASLEPSRLSRMWS